MEAPSLETDFLALYDAQADSLFRHAYYRVHDRELAKDLSQEAFTRVWDYSRKGKVIENKKAFLFRTLNNLIIDYYRKKKESSLDVLQETGFDPSGDDHEQIEASAAGKEALLALTHLEERDRQMVALRYVNEFSVSEVAEVLGESENAVSVRLHRALKKLKDFLEHGPR